MIIIKVQGGLGNQLLQYSMGQVIAREFDKEVLYDVSFFEDNHKYTKRFYLLDKFTIDPSFASREQVNAVRYPYGSLSKALSLVYRACNRYFFDKYYVGYDKGFLPLMQGKKDAYVEGFWQGAPYYKPHQDFLNKAITLKQNERVEAFKRRHDFSRKTSVSVHIRRGDFANPGAGTKTIPKSYYERAVEVVEEKIENPTYFIFSDDVEWVKQELGFLFKQVVYVSGGDLSDYEEFALLKDCNHAILSNSTFCWFATILSDSKEKVATYPKDWQNKYLNKSTDICPDHWIGL